LPDRERRKPVRVNKLAVIAGAGPAGLTAARELLRRSQIVPIVFEADIQVGGISKTVNYRGNRMDLGGHRFFSKSDWVMRWWQEILPIAEDPVGTDEALRISYQGQSREFAPSGPPSAATDSVMLIRRRLSRILHRRRLFDYPLKLNANTLKNMGVAETLRVGSSYAQARFSRRLPESSLEDFLVNRFGERLYRTFFKDYTEKVWGVPCTEISAAWGAQRIKGLSVTKALAHALAAPFRSSTDIAQTRTETSMIERFLYPKLGPGQMWEAVARDVTARGGEVHLQHRVIGIERSGFKVTAVTVRDETTGAARRVACDYFLSTLPVHDLAAMLLPEDERVAHVARRLPYRDFMTVGLLLRRMSLPGKRSRDAAANGMPPDNWIYVQEPDVKVGRLQLFNNWSPALVADPDTIWLGMEYFCREGDELWSMKNGSFIDFAADELVKLNLIKRQDVLDGTVVRVPKAYPAYFGEYRHFDAVRAYLDEFHNLYSIGRNGMHRYNNQDHSMLSSKCAVDSITTGGGAKARIWDINEEGSYHEEQ
jgi:protoporphyrinogen oxidase